MRKVWMTLLSCLVLAAPFSQLRPAGAEELTAENLQGLSYSQSIVLSWKFFAGYRADKSLMILNHLRDSESLSDNEKELVDLIRLTIYRQEGHRKVSVPGSTDKAIEYLTEAIVLDDTSPHARKRRGDAYCKIGNFNYCQRDYAVAWQLIKDKTPESLARHLADRGLAYREAGKDKEGNLDLQEAVRLYRLEGKETEARVYEHLLK